jgi:hypothetical protein
MSMNDTGLVEEILGTAKERFNKWLQNFKPWHGEAGIPERNLSFQFATSFLQHFPRGMAFMEVSFTRQEERSGSRKHLDTYLVANELAILLECKRAVYNQAVVQEIDYDMRRMTPDVLLQLQQRHPTIRPERTIGVVLAETWRFETAQLWNGNSHPMSNLSLDCLPVEWKRGYLQIHTLGSADAVRETERRLYWLYAVSDQIAPSTQPDTSANATEVHRCD